MSDLHKNTERPDYGVDAPGVVRNLFLCAAAGLLVCASTALGLWSDPALSGTLAGIGLGFLASFSATGLGMLWYSKVGKSRMRDRLLDLHPWKGDEAVLDVGCGRGLLLIGAARRLRSGKATGIDVWQSEDLAGNRPEATWENARREGVTQRVEILTADMRQLPFPEGSFDLVLSNAAIHNLSKRQDRDQAICEIVRVLKPGGQALIADIRHLGEYANAFKTAGCAEVRWVGALWKRVLVVLGTWALSGRARSWWKNREPPMG